eukprot:tig00001041_g6568.t2
MGAGAGSRARQQALEQVQVLSDVNASSTRRGSPSHAPESWAYSKKTERRRHLEGAGRRVASDGLAKPALRAPASHPPPASPKGGAAGPLRVPSSYSSGLPGSPLTPAPLNAVAGVHGTRQQPHPHPQPQPQPASRRPASSSSVSEDSDDPDREPSESPEARPWYRPRPRRITSHARQQIEAALAAASVLNAYGGPPAPVPVAAAPARLALPLHRPLPGSDDVDVESDRGAGVGAAGTPYPSLRARIPYPLEPYPAHDMQVAKFKSGAPAAGAGDGIRRRSETPAPHIRVPGSGLDAGNPLRRPLSLPAASGALGTAPRLANRPATPAVRLYGPPRTPRLLLTSFDDLLGTLHSELPLSPADDLSTPSTTPDPPASAPHLLTPLRRASAPEAGGAAGPGLYPPAERRASTPPSAVLNNWTPSPQKAPFRYPASADSLLRGGGGYRRSSVPGPVPGTLAERPALGLPAPGSPQHPSRGLFAPHRLQFDS